MRKRENLPMVAVLLVHLYDKPGFLKRLQQLDEVCHVYPEVGLFVYDAAYAQNEHLERSEVLRLHTPLRLLNGDIRSELSAYNALFKSAQYDYQWALILNDVQLDTGWFPALCSMLTHKEVGLWGVTLGNDGETTAHSQLWGNMIRNRADNGQKHVWVDERFWLANLQVIGKLKGFEERYFKGDVAFRDFGWRMGRFGKQVAIMSQPSITLTKWKKYQIETMLKHYLEVRNQWLFTRLRLSRGKSMLMMLKQLAIEGVGGRKLFTEGYRSGFLDGMKLWFS